MRPIGICTAIFILASLGSTAFAEGIPEQTIQNQHKSCVESCTKSSGGQTAACEKACSCIDIETQKNFSPPEFSELERQIAANPSAPTFTPEIKTKLDAVFAACRP
jgi:hypothetical protein